MVAADAMITGTLGRHAGDKTILDFAAIHRDGELDGRSPRMPMRGSRDQCRRRRPTGGNVPARGEGRIGRRAGMYGAQKARPRQHPGDCCPLWLVAARQGRG